MSIPPRWDLSSLDWHAHAIDEDADHPYGVYVARCGQRLFMGTSLPDEPPGALDYHAHLLLPEGDHPSGVLKARCGALLPMGVTQHDQLPPGLSASTAC